MKSLRVAALMLAMAAGQASSCSLESAFGGVALQIRPGSLTMAMAIAEARKEGILPPPIEESQQAAISNWRKWNWQQQLSGHTGVTPAFYFYDVLGNHFNRVEIDAIGSVQISLHQVPDETTTVLMSTGHVLDLLLQGEMTYQEAKDKDLIMLNGEQADLVDAWIKHSLEKPQPLYPA